MTSASLVAQMVRNPSALQETQVGSLGWEDPLEKGMTTHSSILARRIPWKEEPGGLQSMGSQSVDSAEPLTRSLPHCLLAGCRDASGNWGSRGWQSHKAEEARMPEAAWIPPPSLHPSRTGCAGGKYPHPHLHPQGT